MMNDIMLDQCDKLKTAPDIAALFISFILAFRSNESSSIEKENITVFH